MKNRYLWAFVALFAVTPMPIEAQQRPERFQRREQATVPPAAVFHSPQAANLPTAETLSRGEWLFEVSHRFEPPVSRGSDALWGFDGPVFNRLGLAYAASDRLMLGLLRTNLHDNLELNAKVRFWERRSGNGAYMVGAMAGVAWNTEAPTEAGADENEAQAYGQLILNASFGDRFALGIVPTVLRNPVIEAAESETVFVLGGNAQLYLSDQVSLLAEWIKSPSRPDRRHDSGTFGVELETGGHFFKIVLTNQMRMNPAQFLAGSPFEFESDEWRVGFNITRLLAF